MSPDRCAAPLAPGVLADYWLAELDPADEEAVEEHLLGCAACCGRLREVAALADGIRRLARSGVLRVVVSDAFLARLAREGLRVREYRVPAGGSVACTVTARDDLLVGRLVAKIQEARRVDLVLCDAVGREQRRLEDVPIRPGGGEVAMLEPIDLARKLPASVLRVRMLAVEPAGERLLGEFTFNHTPSPA